MCYNKLTYEIILYAPLLVINYGSIYEVRNNMRVDDILNINKNSIIKNHAAYKIYSHITKLNNPLIITSHK